MIDTGLTAGQVARRLGIAVTTLRSWHRRYGLGPSQHVAGHHRRYDDYDLARLEAMRALTAQGVPTAVAARLAAVGGARTGQPGQPPAGPAPDASPGGLAAAGHGAAVRGLVGAALRLDGVAVRRALSGAVAGGVVTAWEELIRPALASIEAKQAGRHRPVAGGLVDVEHLLSGSVATVLAAVPRPAVPSQALLACADDEQHSLPLEALAAALAQHGIGAWLLGARVPPAALQAAVRRTWPGLVVVWSHAPRTADPAQLAALVASRPRPPVVAAAGPGWEAALPVGATGLASLPAAVALAKVVAAAGATTGAGSQPGPPLGIGWRA